MSLIYINDKTIIKKENENIIELEDAKLTSDDIITASLNIRDVITYPLKLANTTSPEQLKVEAEIKFYENAGLDLTKKYKTNYLVKEIEQESVYLVEAVAIDEEKLHEKFGTILDKTKHIDYISLSMESFSEFYKLYKKEPKRDAFVYLDKEQAFVAVYQNGEYLYSKTLDPLLSTLLKTISLDYDKFVEIISKKGVNKELYSDEEVFLSGDIDKFFSEFFISINNRLSYGRTLFYLENIDNIYFYAPFEIAGIDSLKNYWELSNIHFEIVPVEEINLLDKLTTVYNANHYKDEINFSIFPKPPKFYKTRIFLFSMVMFFTLAIFGGDFGYREYKNIKYQNKIDVLDKKIKVKKQKLVKLEKINQEILKKLSTYRTEIKNINSKEKYIKDVLEKGLNLLNNSKVSNDFILFSKLLKKNNLQAFVISKDKNSFKIGVYTELKNRKFIGMFMDDLLRFNYKNIETDKITTLNNKYYTSLIRFKK